MTAFLWKSKLNEVHEGVTSLMGILQTANKIVEHNNPYYPKVTGNKNSINIPGTTKASSWKFSSRHWLPHKEPGNVEWYTNYQLNAVKSLQTDSQTNKTQPDAGSSSNKMIELEVMILCENRKHRNL